MLILNSAPISSRLNVPDTIEDQVPADELEALRAEIKFALAEQDAVLVAHYYTDPALQALADETGGYVSDSLDMARFGKETDASTLVVAGVRFMGETAKILNPEKRVLMPDLDANCSLDLGCPPDEFSAYCEAHPDRTVVVYANTSAAVKARADWMVTSGSAVDLIRHLMSRGEKILWAPDKYLGNYLQTETGADILLWDGACVVHEEFKGKELEKMRAEYPDATVLVHPESPPQVIAQADVVDSTSGLIKAVRTLPADRFIVATDRGIFYKMQRTAPDKMLLEAPTSGKSATCKSCGRCPWMAMNSMRKLMAVLRNGTNEIHVNAGIARRAVIPIERLLMFSRQRNKLLYGNNDA